MFRFFSTLDHPEAQGLQSHLYRRGKKWLSVILTPVVQKSSDRGERLRGRYIKNENVLYSVNSPSKFSPLCTLRVDPLGRSGECIHVIGGHLFGTSNLGP